MQPEYFGSHPPVLAYLRILVTPIRTTAVSLALDPETQPDPPASVEVAQVVLLPSPAGLPESLTYLVPQALQGQVAVGVPVLVPLGGRDQLGYVLSVEPLAPCRPEGRIELSRLRPIRGIPRPDPAFDVHMVELLRSVAAENCCSLADAMPLAVPERHGAELQSVVSLGDWDGSLPARIGILTRQTLTSLYQALRNAGGTLSRDALELAVRAANFGPALRRARSEGWVQEEQLLLPPKVRTKWVKAVQLVDPAAATASDADDDTTGEKTAAPAIPRQPAPENGKKPRLGAQQKRVLEYLEQRGDPSPVAQAQLCEELAVSASVITGLVNRGLLESTRLQVRRAPGGYDAARDTAPELSPFQGAAAGTIRAAMQRGQGESLLLFGVTGSGKTEVYLHAIEEARAAGRTAALLVPEISLTAQVAAAVRRRLGERVAILHSALSDGERFDEWERVRRGDADVVVGPRSALFSPLKDPAIIILDEEHDGSYKQGERSPRYHAREAAQERARISGGCVVLGSATPSVESFHAALNGDYQFLELPERVNQRPLPTVDVVDLREESRSKPRSIFSRLLEDRLRQRLANGEQSILFLNRRGFSAFVLCRDCGFVPDCPNCDVSLTLHRHRVGVLLCHHCDYMRQAPQVCERCMGPRVGQFGLGTQRVEEAVRQLLPSARIARLDRDSISSKDAHVRIVNQVRDGEIDILVGTQMVTKGFDFPGVTLVGVVTADVALNMPDFRAGERAFQLLTQVSGRAGRGDRPGEVVVQAFNPDHPSIQAAARHDYRGFFQTEIRSREETSYPPFGSLARFLSAHQEEAVARSRIEAAAEMLRPLAASYEVEVRGPAPCPLARLRDRYRFHLLLKAGSRAAIRAVLAEAWPQVQKRIGGIAIDVEPVDLL